MLDVRCQPCILLAKGPSSHATVVIHLTRILALLQLGVFVLDAKGPCSHATVGIHLTRILALLQLGVFVLDDTVGVPVQKGWYVLSACTAAKYRFYCCLQERKYQSNNQLTDRPTDRPPRSVIVQINTRSAPSSSSEPICVCGYSFYEGGAMMDGKSSFAFIV